MTAAKWWSGHHAVLCALHACYTNFAAEKASAEWADAFEPANTPNVPTSFAGQYSAIPQNGGFYLRPIRPTDTSRPLPFVEFFEQSSDKDGPRDSQADLVRVSVGCRIGIGAATNANIIGQAVLDSQALALCRLASVVACDKLRASALALNPGSAFGICYAQTRQPAAIDLTSPNPPTATGSAAIFAVAYFDVFQRQFNPAGIGGA